MFIHNLIYCIRPSDLTDYYYETVNASCDKNITLVLYITVSYITTEKEFGGPGELGVGRCFCCKVENMLLFNIIQIHKLLPYYIFRIYRYVNKFS